MLKREVNFNIGMEIQISKDNKKGKWESSLFSLIIKKFCCNEMEELLKVDETDYSLGGLDRGYDSFTKCIWFGDNCSDPLECNPFVLRGVRFCPFCGEKIEVMY